jgi:hypothetical protein
LSGRPSRVRQREIQQIVRGAIKAGASGVTVNVGGASVVIAFPQDIPLSPDDAGDSNNSFDKVMRGK